MSSYPSIDINDVNVQDGAGVGLDSDGFRLDTSRSEASSRHSGSHSGTPRSNNDRSGKSESEASPQWSSERQEPTHKEENFMDPLMPTPRKPCCRCRCCTGNVRRFSASDRELQEVMDSMRHLQLKKDVVVGGELVMENSHLLKIGNKWKRQGHWQIGPEVERAAKAQLMECIEEESNVRLAFQVPGQPFPWCIPLRFPCCVYMIVVILVCALLVMGIPGSVTIDTNFDSFMESNSDSSSYWNAFLDALSAREGRRLHAAEPVSTSGMWKLAAPLVNPGVYWQSFQDMASLPAMDDRGHWHPCRFLAYLVFGDQSDYGAWIDVNSQDLDRSAIDGSTSQPRRLLPLYKLHQLQLTFATKTPGENILTNTLLSQIQRVENRLKAMPSWKAMCDGTEEVTKPYCEPGISFANIAFAQRLPYRKRPGFAIEKGKTKLSFNGNGSEPLPLELTIGFAQEQGLLALMFPKDKALETNFQVESLPCFDLDQQCATYKSAGHCLPFARFETYMHDFCALTCNFCGLTDAYGSPSAPASERVVVDTIRSSFRFQTFCCTAGVDESAGLKRLKTTWSEFITALVEIMKTEQDGALRVFFTGDGIAGYEAMTAVQSDLQWAGGSYMFVLFYATLHTRSLFLAVGGLFLVMLSIPSALALFCLASGSEAVSLMSCLSIFIVIGIGSDMLFVYTDFWKQSIQHSRDPVKRLKFTYTQAASSTAATTFTTAMSFLANLASVLRPLREFGFFMGACVVMAWTIMFFACPPLLVMGERCHRRLRSSLGVDKKEEVMQKGPRRSVSAKLSRRTSQAFVSMLDPEKKGVGNMHSTFLGERFANFLRDWKCCLLIVFTILTVGSMGMALKNFEQATGVPKIFPADHNQVLGAEYAEKFKVFDIDIANGAKKFATECGNFFESCAQFRCETSGRAIGSSTDCACYSHRSMGECTNPNMMDVTFRVIARQGLPLSAVENANFSATLGSQFPNAVWINQGAGTFEAFETLVENWESGKQMLAVMVTGGRVIARVRSPDTLETLSTCKEDQVCYCGIERCAGAGASRGSLRLSTLNSSNAGGRRLGAEETRLQQAVLTLPHPLADMTRRLVTDAPTEAPAVAEVIQNPADVVVVLGMNVVGESPILGVSKSQPFEFEPSFNLQDPWAQRKFESLCKKTGEQKNLKIQQTRCWLLGFRDFWVAQGKDWPVRPTEDMNAAVHSYANTVQTFNQQTTKYFWFEGKVVKATYIVFFLSVSKYMNSADAMLVKADWDAYISDFNAQAEKAIKGIFHTSKLWVRAEAEKVIIESTVVTLAISLGCVFLGIFIFTRSAHLAFLVMMVVMSIIICLLFFMVVLMEWPIGAIEVLSLIVFVGFAVDYCLHIAHKYHSCHINAVQDLPFEDEEESAGSIVSESPSAASSAMGHGHKRYSREISGASGRRSSKRRASVALLIDDKPDKALTKDVRQSCVNSTLLAANRPEERFARTRYALERMGGAVVGSAFTTAGCAAFLLPCQLAIFTKIGSVVMAVTAYAILYTILPLPAILMICGPCGNDMQALLGFFIGGTKRVIRRKAPEQQPRYEEPDRTIARRYVLHMPTRAMGAVGPGIPATRTRVTASG